MKPHFTTVSQWISAIAAILGIVFYFRGNPIVAIICGVITIIDSLIQCGWGAQTNLGTEFATVIIGLLVAVIAKIPKFACIMLSLCIGNIAVMIIGMVPFLIFMFKKQ